MSAIERETPVTMFVRTTENCNAGCFMCDYANMKNQPFLNLSQVESIAAEAKKSGIRLIRFTGGEPLLDRNMTSFVAYLHNQGLKTSIITNGYFLPRRAAGLVEAGLDQVIVSLDGSTPRIHDNLRKLPGLFANATAGIVDIKAADVDTIVRVNTVVSPYNIGDLEQMLELLTGLDVDQWSLIPLKGADNLWKDQDRNGLLEKYKWFQGMVGNVTKPRLLGYSRDWAGRTDDEAIKYFTTGIPFTPRPVCNLVHRVRFYIPETDRLAACNCVPWRLRDINFQTDIGLSGLNDGSLIPLIGYLHQNGPDVCTGCEPINANLGENPNILDDDIFLF
jgi:cytosylglucuronate decarboxylase